MSGAGAPYQVGAAAPTNGRVHEAAASTGPARAGVLACSRCGQPSPGGGLCEACEDALSQLRQLTAAMSEGGE
jgi:hypothetical protein